MNKFLLLLLPASLVCSCEGKYASAATEAAISNVVNNSAHAAKELVFTDTKSSVIAWKGTKFNKTRFHAGTIQLSNGVLQFDNHKLTGGQFTADMNKIGITDIPPHETEAIQNLTKHLKDDFEVATYPSATFEITNVRYLSNDSLLISGNLKIKEVTHNITIPAKETKRNNKKVYTTIFQFNRFDWNIGKKGSWLEQRLVDKEVELKINLITTN